MAWLWVIAWVEGWVKRWAEQWGDELGLASEPVLVVWWGMPAMVAMWAWLLDLQLVLRRVSWWAEA
jgi:hypothetical protein